VGYDLHITKASNWWESETNPIHLSEWRSLVGRDPELEETSAAEASLPEGTLRYENEGLAVWSAHPTGEQVWFDWRRGSVIVKNPDEATIAKMIAVAGGLGAHVQGDDGESYPLQEAPTSLSGASVMGRLKGWLRGHLTPSSPLPPEFEPGERVRDFRGQPGTVVEVDANASHGLGSIRVKFDDGRELSFAFAAHGLTSVDKGPGGRRTSG